MDPSAGRGSHRAGHKCTRQPGEDPRTAVEFLKDLRDHGFHDIALDYIKVLKAEAQLPAEIKDVLEYEEGRTLIDEAAKTNDLVLRKRCFAARRRSSTAS